MLEVVIVSPGEKKAAAEVAGMSVATTRKMDIGYRNGRLKDWNVQILEVGNLRVFNHIQEKRETENHLRAELRQRNGDTWLRGT